MDRRELRLWCLVHRWTSLACTAFLLLLCLTGLPLIFHDEIDALLGDGIVAPDLPASVPAADLDRIVAAGHARHPQDHVRSLFWDDDHPHIVVLALVPSPDAPPEATRLIALDERTAAVLGEPRLDDTVTRVLLLLHRELFAGLAGEIFLGTMALLFLAALVSGVAIYGPFMRKLAFGAVRRQGSRRLRRLDLHNLIGVATVAWALVVGLTGAMNTVALPLFDLWRSRAMPGLLAPYRDKPPLARPGPVADAARAAREALPDRQITSIVFPKDRFGTPRHYLIWTRGRTPVTAQLYTPVLVDAETGAVSGAAPLPWYLRAIELSRPLHFGDYGGLPLKILWALLDLATVAVLASGLHLWLVRRRTPLEQRLAELEAAPAE
jgi:uncharacterized iron-regulated membrane protein